MPTADESTLTISLQTMTSPKDGNQYLAASRGKLQTAPNQRNLRKKQTLYIGLKILGYLAPKVNGSAKHFASPLARKRH